VTETQKHNIERKNLKLFKNYFGWVYGSVAELLPCRCKVLASTASTGTFKRWASWEEVRLLGCALERDIGTWSFLFSVFASQPPCGEQAPSTTLSQHNEPCHHRPK
jgi:hypothetical protein